MQSSMAWRLFGWHAAAELNGGVMNGSAIDPYFRQVLQFCRIATVFCIV
jgi:hypothetical protein